MTPVERQQGLVDEFLLTEDMTPVRNAEFEFREIPCCYLLVRDAEPSRTIKLNESGSIIWDLCDGRRTIGNIVSALSEEFQHDRAAMKKDVVRALEDLILDEALFIDDRGTL